MASASLVGLLSLSIVASAGATPSRVVVLPADVSGDAPATVATTFADAAAAGVEAAGGETVAAPDGCTNDKCAGEAAGPQGYVLSASVEVKGSDYVIKTRLVDAGGNVVDEQSEPCEICTYEEAGEALQAMVNKAVGPVAEAAGPPAPPPPPSDTPPPPDATPAKSKSGMSSKTLGGLGFAALGVGVGALAGGIALLVLNERPVKSQCEGAQVDADGDCELRYNTLGGGAGLAIGGAVGIGVGVGLLLLRRGRPDVGGGKVEVSASAGGVRLRF